MLVGEIGGSQILVFCNANEQGFTHYESEVVVYMLQKLRCGHVHYLVPGFLETEDKFIAMIEYLDLGRQQ